jgi:hypothetical protein
MSVTVARHRPSPSAPTAIDSGSEGAHHTGGQSGQLECRDCRQPERATQRAIAPDHSRSLADRRCPCAFGCSQARSRKHGPTLPAICPEQFRRPARGSRAFTGRPLGWFVCAGDMSRRAGPPARDPSCRGTSPAAAEVSYGVAMSARSSASNSSTDADLRSRRPTRCRRRSVPVRHAATANPQISASPPLNVKTGIAWRPSACARANLQAADACHATPRTLAYRCTSWYA